MKNKLYILVVFLIAMQYSLAQTGDAVFTFLRYPMSARINAMGGNNVSLVESDPSLIFMNPALLGGEMDKMINFNYLNYIADVNVGSALFTKAWKDKGAWAVGATYFSQGKIKGMNEEGVSTGEFSLKDISLNGSFSYDLSDKWRGGATLKFLYSGLGDYTSIGIGVDAGLSYYNSEKKFSFGFTLKNIGAQLKAYESHRQKMPWDIQLGISKQMKHAPIRFSLTAMYLTKWKLSYIDDIDKELVDDRFFKTLMKHLIIGIDVLPSDNFWIGVGYNPKTAMDMKLQGGNFLTGFSGGAGIRIKMFNIGVSIAKYHPSALSMMLSLSMRIDDFK